MQRCFSCRSNKFFLFKSIFNAPYKKCVITKTHFPVLLMQKFAKVNNSFGGYNYIPDSMYSNVSCILNINSMRSLIIFFAQKKF